MQWQQQVEQGELTDEDGQLIHKSIEVILKGGQFKSVGDVRQKLSILLGESKLVLHGDFIDSELHKAMTTQALVNLHQKSASHASVSDLQQSDQQQSDQQFDYQSDQQQSEQQQSEQQQQQKQEIQELEKEKSLKGKQRKSTNGNSGKIKSNAVVYDSDDEELDEMLRQKEEKSGKRSRLLASSSHNQQYQQQQQQSQKAQWQVSEKLQPCVGGMGELSWPQLVQRLNQYYAEHQLRDGQYINCDEQLQAVTGRKRLHMFEIMKFIRPHLWRGGETQATLIDGGGDGDGLNGSGTDIEFKDVQASSPRQKQKSIAKSKKPKKEKRVSGKDDEYDEVKKPRTSGIMAPLLMSDQLRAVMLATGAISSSSSSSSSSQTADQMSLNGNNNDQQMTMARPTIIKHLWIYIKRHNLQDPKDGRQIICDSMLRAVMGKNKLSSFEMAKCIGKHVWKPDDVVPSQQLGSDQNKTSKKSTVPSQQQGKDQYKTSKKSNKISQKRKASAELLSVSENEGTEHEDDIYAD